MNVARSSPDLLARLRDVLGPAHVLTDADAMAPALTDWRGFYHGLAAAVVRPSTTAEVAAIVELCARLRTPVVAQGGNTGMCGGATPDGSGRSVVLSLARMNRVIEVDALNDTMTVEAGCVLAAIRERAADADRLFPLSLGAEGSCQIGGNLATNAGGINVLRYGNTRDLTLGLEVVLADGRVLNQLRGLRKDNTGYDLKQLFIGSEGTLGIITGAVLKLFPLPRTSVTAWVAVPDAAAAIAMMSALRTALGGRLSAFELISRRCLELVLRHIPGTRDPLSGPSPWYVLTDVEDSASDAPLREPLEQALATALESGRATDAAIAGSNAQARALWRIRESIPDASKDEGLLYRHDISVPISAIPAFIDEAGAMLESRYPGVRIVCFGHVGDGNLHYNCYIPGRERGDPVAVKAVDVNEAVYDLVHRRGGSISAEHGVGQSKYDELPRYKDVVEMDLMRAIKQALDPHGIMNPGKVVQPGATRAPTPP
ncbi:MAG: FAD-binding oxidoreductase [Proteobacteria bacterium]|nr:FAD-binding oxidoreductase [Burkholderiales bacterium]